MSRPVPIEYDLNTWIIMRVSRDRPAAVVRRVTHANGISRYMLFDWSFNPMGARLLGVYDSLTAADDAVPYFESAPSGALHEGWPPGAHKPMHLDEESRADGS